MRTANEPGHHVIFLYNAARQPWRTAELSRRVCQKLYTDRPDGLCGNEDCGQMSAWYAFAAMGFYPVDPVQGTLRTDVAALAREPHCAAQWQGVYPHCRRTFRKELLHQVGQGERTTLHKEFLDLRPHPLGRKGDPRNDQPARHLLVLATRR